MGAIGRRGKAPLKAAIFDVEDPMTLSDLASIGSFISAVAVVISLVYLAGQVRQARHHQ